jgi:hypothetical protein
VLKWYLLRDLVFSPCNVFADVGMSFATLVVMSGRTGKQHVPVHSGMSKILYVINKEDDDMESDNT